MSGTPIWLGDKSSGCTRVVERLNGFSGEPNAAGQYLHDGQVRGDVVTGNSSLQHLGDVVPPPADAGWIGEVERDGATATALLTRRCPEPTATSPSAPSPS